MNRRSITDCALAAAAAWIAAMLLAVLFKDIPFTGWALSTAILLQLLSKVSWKAWLASILLAIPMLLVCGPKYAILGIAVGCTSVGGGRWMHRETDWLHAILPMVIAYATVGVDVIHMIVYHYTPHRIDSVLLEFEKRWAFSLSITLWQWCKAHIYVYSFFFAVYMCLPCVVIVTAALAGKTGASRILKPLLLACLAVVPFYLLFPAVGPAHIADSHPLRNCIPSLHVAWAILLWMNAESNLSKRILAVFVVLTTLSTLALGEHYLVDLVAAVPYAFVVQWCVRKAHAYRFSMLLAHQSQP